MQITCIKYNILSFLCHATFILISIYTQHKNHYDFCLVSSWYNFTSNRRNFNFTVEESNIWSNTFMLGKVQLNSRRKRIDGQFVLWIVLEFLKVKRRNSKYQNSEAIHYVHASNIHYLHYLFIRYYFLISIDILK